MSSKPPLTLDELRITPEYAALTTKMKIFVDAYIESHGDVIDAIQEAYKCKGPREEKIVKWQIMRHPKIIAVLEAWSNKDEKEIFLENLKAHLRLKDVSLTKVRLMELYATMMGWEVPGTTQRIKAIAYEKSATMKVRREQNITRILSNRERRAQRAEKRRVEKEAKPEEDAVDYGLEIYEAQADGDQGNGEAGG